MDVSFKLFLEDGGAYVVGPGRVALLRAVDELGSLHKAAQQQGMSYRWAWGRLKDAEKALGVALLQPSSRPGKGNTRELTPEARELLAWFSGMETRIHTILHDARAARPSFLRMSG